MILGAVWKLKHGDNGYDSLIPGDQCRELVAIDESIKILELCGQRIAFARKYSLSIKGLRQQLNRSLPNIADDVASLSLAATGTKEIMPYNAFLIGSSQFPISPGSISESPEFQKTYNDIGQNSTSPSSLFNGDMMRGYNPLVDSLNTSNQPWTGDFATLYPNDAPTYRELILKICLGYMC